MRTGASAVRASISQRCATVDRPRDLRSLLKGVPRDRLVIGKLPSLPPFPDKFAIKPVGDLIG
jgi:hypothetical protein